MTPTQLRRIGASLLAAAGAIALSVELLSPSAAAADEARLTLFADVASRDVDALRRTLDRDRGAACAADIDGNTPLHVAASLGWRDGVALLLARGADANARNASGTPPLALAINAAADRRGAVVAALLAAGASPDAKLAGGGDVRRLAASRRPADPTLIAMLGNPARR